jgi:hypothetical protein
MSVTGSQLNPTKNELIIALVQKELKFSAKLLGLGTDYSAFAGKGVKSVSVPRLSSFTVENRASAAPGTTQDLSTAKDTIELNIRAHVQWLIDSMDEVESSIEASIQFALRSAAAHGRFFDEQVIATLDAAAGLNVGAGPITRDYVLAMRKELLKNDADLSRMALLISTEQEHEMLKIDEFTKNDVFGGPQAPIYSGQIGRVYGVPVIMHNGVADGKAYMFEQSGIGYAFQMQPNMAEQPAVEYGTTAKLVAMDQKYGIAALQKGEKGKLATQSPLIVKMSA